MRGKEQQAVEALVGQLRAASDFGQPDTRRVVWRDDFDRVTVMRLRVELETIDAAVAPLVEEAG